MRGFRTRAIPALSVGVVAKTIWSYASRPFIDRNYPRNYRAAGGNDSGGLREAAERRGFRLGMASDNAGVPAFSQALRESFTSVTPENALKWGALRRELSGPYDFSKADAIVERALGLNAKIRGHALVWGKFPGDGFPLDLAMKLDAAANPKAALQAIMEEHIAGVMGRYAGRIETWDVVNEPFELFRNRIDRNIFYQAMGIEYIAFAFDLARRCDPGAKLFLNENLIQYDDARARSFLDLIRALKDRGAKIDGIGIQSHVFMGIPSLRQLSAYLRAIADLRLDIEITEMDVSIDLFRKAKDPFEAQGEFFRAFAETCLECRACKGITFWGIGDADTWMDKTPPLLFSRPNSPLLYDDGMRPKPAHRGMLEALGSSGSPGRSKPDGTKEL